MLKYTLLFLITVTLIPVSLFAQGSPIDELRSPAIPAFALQSGTVTAVPIPTTPNEFTADLQNFASGNGLRQGYGVEATLRSIFTPSDFVTLRASLVDPGFVSCLGRTAAISIATGSSGLPSDTSGTSFSFGFRIQPLIGKASDTVDKRLKEYDIERLWPSSIVDQLKTPGSVYLIAGNRYTTADVKNAASTVINANIPLALTKPDPPSTTEWNEIRKAVDSIIDDCSINNTQDQATWVNALANAKNKFLNSDTAKKLLHSLHDLSLNRYGWVCELDAAGKWDWIGSASDDEHFEKMGAWASVGYKDESGLNIAVLGRYIIYTPAIDSSNRLQVGASLGYHGAQWNITGEYIEQGVSELSSMKTDSTVKTNRYDLNITYSPNSLMTASLTVGKDFMDTKAKISPVLAVLGFNFNWSILSKVLAASQ